MFAIFIIIIKFDQELFGIYIFIIFKLISNTEWSYILLKIIFLIFIAYENIKLFVTFVASLFFLFSCEKEKVETCGFDTIRLTESFLTEYAKGDGVDNYMIALASGPTVFDPTNQQWHTENDGWVMLISLFAEPVANLGAPEIPEGKYTLGSAPGAGVWSSEEDVNQLYYTGKDGVSTLVPVSGELTFAKTADGYIMTGKFWLLTRKNIA